MPLQLAIPMTLTSLVVLVVLVAYFSMTLTTLVVPCGAYSTCSKMIAFSAVPGIKAGKALPDDQRDDEGGAGTVRMRKRTR